MMVLIVLRKVSLAMHVADGAYPITLFGPVSIRCGGTRRLGAAEGWEDGDTDPRVVGYEAGCSPQGCVSAY